MVYQQRRLDRTFAALADPTRRAILARLAHGDSTIGDLARPFAMSLPAVSKHLQVLARARLTTIRRDGRVRRCRLEPAPLREAAEWVATYRRFWEGQLDQLALYLGDTTAQRSDPCPAPAPPSPSSSRSAASSPRRRSGSSRHGPRRKS